MHVGTSSQPLHGTTFFLVWILITFSNRLGGVSGKVDGQCSQEGNYKPVGQITWALFLGLALPVHHTVVQVEEEGQNIDCRRAFEKMVEALPLRSREQKNS